MKRTTAFHKAFLDYVGRPSNERTEINNKTCLSIEGIPPQTRYTDTLCHYTVCLRIKKYKVRTPGWPAVDQQY